jgi:hypothetical protein
LNHTSASYAKDSKVYNDGFVNLALGSSAAQSVILMAIVIALTGVSVPLRRAHGALWLSPRWSAEPARASSSPTWSW